jgi:DNA-binding transcriptional regulator WhiA
MKGTSFVTCASKKYKIVYHPNRSGGQFHTKSKEIHIGKRCSKQDALEVLLHEIAEVILVERNLRYAQEKENKENGDYLFSFNHGEFEMFIKDLTLAIQEIIIKEGNNDKDYL